MQSLADLSVHPSSKLKAKLKEREKRLKDLRALFPELRKRPRSLSAQYMTRGSVLEEESELRSQIAALKLELFRSGEPIGPRAKRGKLRTNAESAKPKSPAASKATVFAPSDDYRSATFRGKSYSFTSRQAQVVEMLHEAYLNGTPELGKDHILEKLGSPNSRLRDTFKKHPAWNSLIVSGEKRGAYRLNLRKSHSQH